MSISIRFHIFIVAGLTFILGIALKKIFKLKPSARRIDQLFPFAAIYLPLALLYAFIVNELPLTGFSIDPVYDSESSSGLGPQSINGNAIAALIMYIASVFLNLVVWLYALYTVVVHYLYQRLSQKNTR